MCNGYTRPSVVVVDSVVVCCYQCKTLENLYCTQSFRSTCTGWRDGRSSNRSGRQQQRPSCTISSICERWRPPNGSLTIHLQEVRILVVSSHFCWSTSFAFSFEVNLESELRDWCVQIAKWACGCCAAPTCSSRSQCPACGRANTYAADDCSALLCRRLEWWENQRAV